jgi:FMN reductase
VSAYEAANNGFGDEGFTPSGGSAWFGRQAGLPANGHEAGAPNQYGAGAGTNGLAYADLGFPEIPAGPTFAAPFAAPPATRAPDPASSSALLPARANPGPPRPGPAGDVLRLVAVTAGLGQPSTARILADRLAEAARGRLGERGRQVLVEVLELRDLALDIAGAMVAGFPGAKLRAALDAVEGADGLIAVSPIYTASYSGLFKSFFDVLDKDALTSKPTLIAATGGTARHSLALDHALRPMFAYLRAFIVPTAVFAASEDWASAGEGALFERIERAGGELADLMAGQPAAARRRRDEFEDVVPFEQRMAALRSGI